MNIPTADIVIVEPGTTWPASGLAKEEGGNLDAQTTLLETIATNTGGGATAANQSTEIAALTAIVTSISTVSTNTGAVSTATGTVADAQATSATASWSVVALLKGLWTQLGSIITKLNGGLPAALGVGGGVKVDGSGTALPISGTVTANAGTNLNTSALALETGGNLAAIAANTGNGATSANQATEIASLSTIATNTVQGAAGTGVSLPAGGSGLFGWLSGIYNALINPLAVTGSFWQATQPVSVAATLQVSESGIDNAVLASPTITTTGPGTSYNTAGYGLISFSFGGAWAGDILIEVSNDGTYYFPSQVRGSSADDTLDVISGPGIYLHTPTTTYVRYNVLSIQGSVAGKVVGKIGQSTPSPLALAQAVDPATGVQVQANIAGGIGRDANNNLIVSDAPLPINLVGPVGANLIVDTLGYQSIQITTQAMAGAVAFSNDKITWQSWDGTSGNGVNTGTIVANTNYSWPCAGRYARFAITTAGTATAFLRSQPFMLGTNVNAINGSTIGTGGVAGLIGVGGANAPGIAPTANPIVAGAIDTSGFVRRVLSDTFGRLIVDGLGSDGTYRPIGQMPPAASFQNLPSQFVQLADMIDGQSMPDLFAQMLTELRMISLYLYNLPQNLNNTTPPMDDPVYYRNNPQDLL